MISPLLSQFMILSLSLLEAALLEVNTALSPVLDVVVVMPNLIPEVANLLDDGTAANFGDRVVTPPPASAVVTPPAVVFVVVDDVFVSANNDDALLSLLFV